MDLKNDPLLKNVPEIKGFKVLRPAVLYAKIGQGGMGAVYRGRHINLEVDVAVKCLKASLAEESTQFITRFHREAKIAAGIHHENLIQVFDVASEAGVYYLVMEFISGETLRERVRRKGPLKEREAATILLGAARGLAVAHKKRIVHRDIKPDNILISREGVVKVADLGIARAAGNDDFQTLTYGSLGTPQYMPPEQWVDASKVAATADIWSLGATLYFMLVGENAIQAKTPGECTLRICNHDFPDVVDRCPGVDGRLRTLLRRMTERDPLQRHPSAVEVARELEQWLGETVVELADEDTGSKVETLVSPPPAHTLAEIRVEVGTRSGTGAGQNLPTEAVVRPEHTGPPAARSPWGRRVATIAAGLVGVGLAAFGVLKLIPREDSKGGAVVPPTVHLDSEALLEGVLLTKERRFKLEGSVKDARDAAVTLQAAGKDVQTVSLVGGTFSTDLDLVPDALNAFTLSCAGAPPVQFSIEQDSQAPVVRGLIEPDLTHTTTRLASIDCAVEVQDKHLKGVTIASLEAEAEGADRSRWRASGVRLDEGKNTLQVEAWDAAGNRETQRYTVIRDTKPPEIRDIVSPQEGARTRKDSIDVLVVVSDENLESVFIGSVEAKPEAGERWKATGVRLPVETTNSIEIRALDKAGNPGTRSLSVIRDMTAPSIIRHSPRELVPDRVAEARLEFDEPVTKLVHDGKTFSPKSVSCTIPIRAPRKEGPFIEEFELTDELGNEASRQHEFQAGALPPAPVIVLASPAVTGAEPFFTTASSLRLAGRVENATGDSLTVTVGGKPRTIALDGGRFVLLAELPLDKRSRIELQHDDVSQGFDVVQDSQDPRITLQSPAADALPTSLAEVAVVVRVEDVNLDQVLFESTPMKAVGEETWRLDRVALSEGPNSFRVTATDRAGRTGSLPITLPRTIPPPPEPTPVQPVVSAPRLPEGWEALDATPGHGRWAKRAKEPKSGIVFVLVAPGEFEMGSPPKERDRKNDETLHHVTLTKAFYLAETETTQAQYRKVTRKNPSEFEGDDRPVESVTWSDAASFCKQIQCELPSEAQWEYACRAGKQEPFHFGATLPKNLANHNGDDNWEVARDGRGPQTFSVKKYKPNAWGLYDMHGNVWEWCADAYAPYPSSPVTDPLVTNGKERVNRGGSWKLAGRDSRSARRDKDTPDKEYDQLGFRCARTLPD